MRPTLVHRYAFSIRDAIEALLGDAVGDCEAWRIRVEGDEVVIDVIGPAEVTFKVGDYEYTVDGRTPPVEPTVADVASLASNGMAKSYVSPHEATDASGSASRGIGSDTPADGETPPAAPLAPPEPELKGGDNAKRAGIVCGERLFQVFLDVADEAAAKADVYRRCGITTRKMLDHDERARAVWLEIDRMYALWREGYDVELD